MWESIGSPCPLKLIEFGPGRGTLMADLLRALTPFPQLKSAISVNFIEISPFLRKLQASTLGLTYPDSPAYLHGKRTGLRIPLREGEDSSIIVNTSLTRKDGIQVSWTQSLTDVPPGPSIIIAHEFFDALPVHQFELTKEGWRERLIGLHPHCSNGENFCFIQSPSPTVASRGLLRKEFYPELPVFNEEKNILIEVSAEGLALGQEIGLRLSTNKGAALIIDYGHDHPSSFSLRAIKDHKRLCSILELPGEADISCDVDFLTLARSTRWARKMRSSRDPIFDQQNKHPGSNNDPPPHRDLHSHPTEEDGNYLDLVSYGPVSQADFLTNLGIEPRLAKLLVNVENEEQAECLISAFNRLTSSSHMGNIYKVSSFFLTTENSSPHSVGSFGYSQGSQ
eukprot:TRINITY_DN1908_c0_g1_i4.p1 TRINITY_DN1908_c0_g1~~TRINITY_DN1908_c0_g1_i4.p1  ORF type:complete len:395 (-),score=74.33 TRINITY_DN1908_c0_g1_i4:322-1506(-)